MGRRQHRELGTLCLFSGGSIDQILHVLCAMRYTFDYLALQANGETDDIRVMKANINPISHRAFMFQTFQASPLDIL